MHPHVHSRPRYGLFYQPGGVPVVLISKRVKVYVFCELHACQLRGISNIMLKAGRTPQLVTLQAPPTKTKLLQGATCLRRVN